MITPHCDKPQEAHLFLAQENRRPLNWFDKHRAGLAEGREESLIIEMIAQRQGLNVSGYEVGPNTVRAIGALYWIYDRGGEELLDDVLETAVACWKHSKDGLKDRSLKGLAFFFDAFSAHDVDRNIARLAFKNVSPTQATVEAVKETRVNGGNNHTEFARYLLRAFNRETHRKLRSSILERNADLRRRRSKADADSRTA